MSAGVCSRNGFFSSFAWFQHWTGTGRASSSASSFVRVRRALFRGKKKKNRTRPVGRVPSNQWQSDMRNRFFYSFPTVGRGRLVGKRYGPRATKQQRTHTHTQKKKKVSLVIRLQDVFTASTEDVDDDDGVAGVRHRAPPSAPPSNCWQATDPGARQVVHL